ncbi:DUF3168 domain-containing protein [Asticcacaulis sp. YBE204]|uniref:DUF3168 domain-containing protein n=1 Tax=Asticcacaulis sp. YBE204 TaxID=1282363 RepID=UPI0003C3EFDF|nr:DUF3168 domain-containing protein [Asticcacaulis sp. YBE204]ESQ79546.1 hypothetical protein AEYBE204_06805 [Asticcacaulis sp. YBE204]
MALDPLRDVQKALIAHLKSQHTLKVWLGNMVRIYDDVPPDPVFPYVALTRVEAQAVSGADTATEQVITLMAVSRFSGTEEARAIAFELRVVLDQAALSLDDQHLVSVRVSYLDVFRSADKRSIYGLVRLRVVTEANPI